MSRSSAWASVRGRWVLLAGRERSLLKLVAVVVLGSALWQWGLAGVLHTVRTADAQRKALDTQLQQMQALQARAQALQRQAPLSYDDALRALMTATQQSLGGTAQITVAAERATVTLQGAPADALAQWLEQARLNARSVPLEARLVRNTTNTKTIWSGVLVMALPQRP